MKTNTDFKKDYSRQRAAIVNTKLSKYGPIGNNNNNKTK